MKIFIEKLPGFAKDEYGAFEIKLDKRSTYQIADFEDLLSRISTHVKEQGLEMQRIFSIYSKQPSGTINYNDLKKILELVGF